MNTYTFKYKELPSRFSEDGNDFIDKTYMIEVPLSHSMIQDCYLYNRCDASHELKSYLLSGLSNTIDKIVLELAPEHEDLNILKKELEIKII